MDRASIDKLLSVASESDCKALEVLFSSWQKKFDAYKENDCRTNLAEYQAVEKALKAKMAEIEAKSDDAGLCEPLENLMAVTSFLKNLGYKIAKSKIYKDAKSGLIKVGADGSVQEEHARAYAERHLKKIKSATGDDAETDEYVKKVKKAELRKLEAQTEKIEFDLSREQGKYLLKSDVETQFASKWSALESSVKHMHRSKCIDLITAVGGDIKKRDVYIDLCFAEIDRLFNELASIDELKIYLQD